MFWNKFFTVLTFILWISTGLVSYAATYTVSNLNDAGAGSLREAINSANAVAGPHTINFSVTGTISLTTGNFANINRQITIDGGTLGNVVLNCNNSADFGFFLVDATCVNSEIRNMVINNFKVHGIAIISANATGIKVTNCRIGTNAAGTAASTLAGSVNGIVIDGSSGNTISNCVISGCRAFGIQVSNGDNNIFTGNIIGLNAAGTATIPNTFSGIQLANNSDNTTIGGSTVAARNVISGNGNHGIQIVNTSINTKIYGNYIGTNSAGTAGFGNAQQGIHILNTSTGTEVGSATAGTGNVISANGFSGVYIDEVCNNTIVKGNIIGLNATGTAVIPNIQNGISVAAASNCVIGGYTANERNVVSGNGTGNMGFGPNQFSGISASTFGANPCTNTQIIGNYVGVGSNGTTQLENGNHGIWLYNANSSLVENNIVSINAGNTGTIIAEQNRSVIYIYNTNAGTVVKGNTILRGRRSGLYLENVSNVTVGGTNAADRNLIQSAQQHGIEMVNASNVSIYGNSIGTDAAGTVNLGNGMSGIYISGTSTTNEIGGIASGKPNKIAYNSGYGVAVTDVNSRFNPIRKNEIYCNVNKGIFLNSAGNENLSAPTVNPASNLSNVYGTAGANAIVDLYYTDPGCNPCSGGTQQGKTFIATVTANGSGNWSYTSGVTGINVTATQTNAANSTSEFSSCSALPVELIYFEATVSSSNTVWLNWSTAGEINSDVFILETSTDGIHFEETGRVKAAGNSTHLIVYSFEDVSPESGVNYYRIKILDRDHSFEYSDVKAVNLHDAFISAFPNPTGGLITVSSAEELTSLVLLTVTGQELISLTPSALQSTLDLRSMSRGVYVLQAYSASGSSQVKVILE